MEEVGVLRETVGSCNNHATPQDKIHFKKFFFFCRKIGAPLDGKRPTLGQRLCHRATEPQRRLGKKANPLIFLVFLCAWGVCGGYYAIHQIFQMDGPELGRHQPGRVDGSPQRLSFAQRLRGPVPAALSAVVAGLGLRRIRRPRPRRRARTAAAGDPKRSPTRASVREPIPGTQASAQIDASSSEEPPAAPAVWNFSVTADALPRGAASSHIRGGGSSGQITDRPIPAASFRPDRPPAAPSRSSPPRRC